MLWEYTDNIASLYFNGKSETPDELLADIYRLHRREFGQEFEIEKYLNNCIDFSSLCHSDFGLFAKGPKKILDLYFLCLEKHKMIPYYYDYEILENTLNSDLVILILGSSYFIGRDFKFKKLNNLIP